MDISLITSGQVAKSQEMKRIIAALLLSINTCFAFGQDILRGLILEEYEVKDSNLDSLIEAFLKAQSQCIGSLKNTVAVMRYEPNVQGDTNAITLRVVHSRDLSQSEYRGFVKHSCRTVFLYNGIEKLDLLENTSDWNEFKISQRITYGNYLVKGNDTLYLIAPWPYKARWVIFQKENFLFWDKKYNHSCNIKEEENSIEELLGEGWRQP